MTNEELYERANTAITELFSDNSVSAHKCAENLESVIGEMQVMIDSFRIDTYGNPIREVDARSHPASVLKEGKMKLTERQKSNLKGVKKLEKITLEPAFKDGRFSGIVIGDRLIEDGEVVEFIKKLEKEKGEER